MVTSGSAASCAKATRPPGEIGGGGKQSTLHRRMVHHPTRRIPAGIWIREKRDGFAPRCLRGYNPAI